MDEEVIFTDHTWTFPEEDVLLGCTSGGDLFAIEGFDILQNFAFDSRSNYTCLKTYTGGFCTSTDDGILAFYRFIQPEGTNTHAKKRFEFIRKWTCDSLRNYKIVSIASYEVNKDSEIYLGIATKNQSIVYLNIMKQIYNGNKSGQFLAGQLEEELVPSDEI